MLDVFQTDDGIFHRAVLSLNKLVLVHLVVERLAMLSGQATEWEWMVWPMHALWAVDPTPVSGRETLILDAKRQAFDTGISMLADLTRDRATSLSVTLAAQPAKLPDWLMLSPAS